MKKRLLEYGLQNKKNVLCAVWDDSTKFALYLGN